MSLRVLQPPDWPHPRGYANGMLGEGRIVFVASGDLWQWQDGALRQLTQGAGNSPDDLRYLVTVIRLLPDLERNGDLAEHVARRAVRGLGAELTARSRGLVERMGEVAVRMWRLATDAYAERLATGALQVDSLDDEMDDLHVSLTVEVVAGTMPLPVAVELAMVARFYERFGDHAVNVAKRVATLAEGAASPA